MLVFVHLMIYGFILWVGRGLIGLAKTGHWGGTD
jgi:hypothetical protein